MRLAYCALIIPAAILAAAPGADRNVTFSKDILPVLQKNCQACHRPGEAAPMSFLTYSETRPWAKAIKQAVATRKMPPWFADPHVGKFSNDRRMDEADIDKLVAWADSGAPEGNPNDAPKPVAWTEGWQIGAPDQIYEMKADFPVPASGTVEYQYIVIPTGLTADRWVQAAEARPGNRAVVHHILAFVREPGSEWLKDAVPGVPFVPGHSKNGGGRGMADDTIAGFAPGVPAVPLEPGQARLIKAGSDIVLQLHYTASGKAQSDRSKLGLIWAKEPPKQRVLTSAVGTSKFAIPPGDPNYRVDAEMTLHASATLVSLLPHMHLRGKAFSYQLTFPDGRREDILSVPKYDFNWQLWYLPAGQITLPAGTKISCTAYYDNSANNAANPDPKALVKWGEQSWEEMMFGFFDVAIDAGMNKMDLYRPKKQTSQLTPGRTGE